jgi:hypothetical protein
VLHGAEKGWCEGLIVYVATFVAEQAQDHSVEEVDEPPELGDLLWRAFGREARAVRQVIARGKETLKLARNRWKDWNMGR